MSTTSTLRLDDVTLDPAIQVRSGLEALTVERYTDALDTLPPISVVRTPDGAQLVVDGFHRVEAARLAGRSHIDAMVQAGTREHARGLAALANLHHGLPLKGYERAEAIRRIHEAQPERSLRDIAKLVGCSHETVRRAVTNVTPLHPAVDGMIATWRSISETFGTQDDPLSMKVREYADMTVRVLADFVDGTLSKAFVCDHFTWMQSTVQQRVEINELERELAELEREPAGTQTLAAHKRIIDRLHTIQNDAGEQALRLMRQAGKLLAEMPADEVAQHRAVLQAAGMAV